MLIVLVPAVLVAALSIRLAFVGTVPEAVNTIPWKISGYPAEQHEVWRSRVCNIHHRLWVRDHHAKTEPLHFILQLDPLKPPFTDPNQSMRPDQPLHAAVHKTLMDAFYDQSRSIVHRMAHENSAQGSVDDEYLSILTTVTSILTNDLARAEYTRLFVPALSSQGFTEKWKEDHTVASERFERLMKLCA